jgi:hypothetical protein
MTYRRFKLPETQQTVATVATVAGGSAETRKSGGTPLARARDIHTAKFNNNNTNINALHTSEAVSSCKGGAASPAPVFARDTATVATLQHFAPAPDYRAALAAFKEARPYGVTRFRHDQACWAAEMFLTEWESLAVEFKWTAADIFDPPRANRIGLGYASRSSPRSGPSTPSPKVTAFLTGSRGRPGSIHIRWRLGIE